MKLSIIVPVYKVEPYLRRCVDSILDQTFTDFEVILVDDGSPDNCGAICDEYASKDERVKVIHKANGGISSARNAGLDIAQGEYIGFVDSDDYIAPRMYERLLQETDHYNADIVACSFVSGTEDAYPFPEKVCEKKACLVLERKEFLSKLFPHNAGKLDVVIWSKIYRRSIFDTLRFPENKIFEDTYLWLPILNNAQRVAVIPDALYYYYQRAGSIMNNGFKTEFFNNHYEIMLQRLEIFSEIGEEEQCEYQLNEILSCYLMNYFAVNRLYPELREDFKTIRTDFNKRYFTLMSCDKICKMGKLILNVHYVFPKLAYYLAVKYMPHCVYGFMRRNERKELQL